MNKIIARRSIEEARKFFLSNPSDTIQCINSKGEEKECSSFPEAVAFFDPVVMENPQAFPFYNSDYKKPFDMPMNHSGMDLRDYFAAKSMQGILANPDEMKHIVTDSENDLSEGENIANHAYYIADAMLKARTKTP